MPTLEQRLVTQGVLSDEQLGRYNKGGSLPEEPCRLRFAHTSPIYVTLGGKGPFVRSSVKEAQAMLESFERFARKTAGEKYLDEIIEAIQKASFAQPKTYRSR